MTSGEAVGLTSCQESLEVFFDQAQLPQRHVQALLVRRMAMPPVHLHRHQGSGDVVPQMVRESATEGPQNRQSFGPDNGGAQLVELPGQLVHAEGDVTHFVIACRHSKWLKVCLGQSADLRSHLVEWQAECTGDPACQGDAQHQGDGADGQRR